MMRAESSLREVLAARRGEERRGRWELVQQSSERRSYINI